MDHETRLEHNRVWNHRVVLGISVLLNVEILLNDSFRIGEKGPLRTDARAELLERVMIVGGNGDDLRIRNRDLRVERGELEMLLMLLRT